MSNAVKGEVTAKHALFVMAGFLGTIIAVNAVFITLAAQTFPGEVVKKSYVQGLRYNETLADRAVQAQLGWRASADLEAADGGPSLRIVLHEGSGAPLRGLTLTGALRRPVEPEADRPLAFTEIAPGIYRAPLPNLRPGQWEIAVRAASAKAHLDITGRRTWPSSTLP